MSWRARLGVLAGLLVLAACQTVMPDSVEESSFQPSDKPVTVDNFSANSRLAELAKAQHPRILATYGGEYSDPKLERMVAKVVGNLTTVSANPTQTYRITILNSPNVNAFALPGAYVVFNSGFIQQARSPDEILGVLAHEAAHVTQRHSVQSIAGDMSANILVSVLFVGTSNIMSGLIYAADTLHSLQYSRAHELEADRLGGRVEIEPGAAEHDPGRFDGGHHTPARCAARPSSVARLASITCGRSETSGPPISHHAWPRVVQPS